VRALLDQLAVIDADFESINGPLAGEPTDTLPVLGLTVTITRDELRDLVQRRREGVLNKLENKGIRIAPDPAPAFPPGTVIEVAHDEVAYDYAAKVNLGVIS